MVLSFKARNVQSVTFGTGGERAGDKGQHRHLARWLWESSWVTGLAPHRKAEHRVVKPLMQKQFWGRERGRSAPSTCSSPNWPLRGFIPAALSHCRGLWRFGIVPGCCKAQPGTWAVFVLPWDSTAKGQPQPHSTERWVWDTHTAQESQHRFTRKNKWSAPRRASCLTSPPGLNYIFKNAIVIHPVLSH